MDIAVTPVTDEGTARRAYDIIRQATVLDTPEVPPIGWEGYRSGSHSAVPGRRIERFLAEVDGVPAGVLHLEFPESDNLDQLHLQVLQVHPGRRRRGVGRALHALAVSRAREEGRHRLIGNAAHTTPDGDSTPAAAFAAAVGARPAMPEWRSRLDLAALDPARLDGLWADARARAAGYRLVRWDAETPEEFLGDAAYLFARASVDMPSGDIDQEAFTVDGRHIRRMGAVLRARNRIPRSVGAVHEASGRLVAWTFLVTRTDQEDWHAWQSLTVVGPEHRGHHLGMLVKAENLRHARATLPHLRAVDTYTAAENRHMIAINEALGFRPRESWTMWQQSL